jgi:DNA-binding transcriptional LysR family regulator
VQCDKVLSAHGSNDAWSSNARRADFPSNCRPPLARLSDLGHHRVLLFNIKPYRTRWLFRDGDGREESVPISGDLTLAPAGSLFMAALSGLGAALLPDWLVDDAIAAGGLVDVFPDHRATATTFDTAAWLVYPSRTYLPNKVRVMIDFLKARLG